MAIAACNCQCCMRHRESNNLLIGEGFWGKACANSVSNLGKANTLIEEILDETNKTYGMSDPQAFKIRRIRTMILEYFEK